jgi:hypothetical protein
MNRRSFGVSIASGALGALTPVFVTARGGQLVDDELIELSPVTVLNHLLGRTHAEVRVSLQARQLGKEVLLSSNGALTVNKIPLKVEYDRDGVSYFARFPVDGDVVRLEYRRSQFQSDIVQLVLPLFQIHSYPKTYRAPETVSFVLARPIQEPSTAVSSESHGLSIQTSRMKIYFARSKLPTDKDPELTFDPILKDKAQSAGRFTANLYRQQRTPMKDVSQHFQAGYIVATVSDEFKIDILG